MGSNLQDEGVLNDNEHGIENEEHDDEPKPVKDADDTVESPRLSDSSSDSSSSSSSSSSSGSNDSEDDVDRGTISNRFPGRKMSFGCLLSEHSPISYIVSCSSVIEHPNY